MQSNLNDIIQKLDSFIKKFYLNQMIRGLIYFLSLALLIVLFVLLLEYFGKFNSQARTVLFYSSLTILGLILIKLIIIPLSKYLQIGKTLSHEQAAKIVGKHFGDISDKLINLLQLNSQLEQNDSQLLLASIDQKVAGLKPIPFGLAIDLGENKRYLKYLALPMAIFIAIYFIDPALISESSGRLIAHGQEIVASAPYQLDIENEKLQSFKNEDFKLNIKASGKEIPSRLMIVVEGEEFLMRQTEFAQFQHQFKNLQKSLSFYITDGEFDSPNYSLKVITPPSLIDFEVEATYPPYLNRKNETFTNTGDLNVPEGSRLRWLVRTEATSEMKFIIGDSASNFTPNSEDQYSYSNYFKRSAPYGLNLVNKELEQSDTVMYRLKIIPDQRPEIILQPQGDSLNFKNVYFEGTIRDDHGFSALYFYSSLIRKDGSNQKFNRIEIPINPKLNQSRYYYRWDLTDVEVNSGDRLEYYFEVWDNDGVNGRKSARTNKMGFSAPSKKELKKKNKEKNEEIKDELEKNIALSQEINRDLAKLKEKMINKKEVGFQEKKQLESLIKKQKELRQSVENLQKQQKANNQIEKQFGQQNEELIQKQQQLEELFEKVMSEEMKKTMEELEKLMEEFQKDKLENALEKMEFDNEQLEQELDRNLELFKQLEVEKELADAIEKLDEIKKDQEELKEKTADKKTDQEELEKEQKELNKEFEELEKDLDELKKKNEELEQPNEIDDTQSLEEQIKEDMKESLEQIKKNQRSKAGEQQEGSQEGMEELSESLEGMQMQMQSQQAAENLEDLRSLLENLITLSFDQEELMEELRSTERDDPKYVDLAQEQRKLQDDTEIIKDSLYALSKRVMMIEATVNREISSINFNMKKAIDELGERNTPQANSRQQYAMTSINNLALLLDEAVQSMQSQMQSSGQCKKPGSGKPKPGNGKSPSNLKSLQQQLNQQLESLKKQMKGGKQKGQKGENGSMPGMSKELAQMAAKQAAIRRSLEEIQKQIGESESGKAGNLKKLGDLMEQTETDLVNKSITNETLLRQQEILSRLLESERAEREREKEERRESREFTDEINRNPNSILEYNRRKEREIELLQTLPPSFSPFYKGKVTEYFNKIEQ